MKALLVKQASGLLLASALSLATALSATTPVHSPAISGPVNFSITNSTVPVYDLTGSYQFDHVVALARGKTVDVSLGLAVQQDAAGGLLGAGVTNIQVGGELVPAAYKASGKVTGGGGKATRVTLSVRWVSQGAAVGTNGAFTISAVYTLEVSRGSLEGTVRGLAKVAKLGSGTIKAPVSGVPLPAGVDGSWSVNMLLQPPGGAGSISLPNGRSFQARLTGSLSPRSALGIIKLAGVGSDRGNALSIGVAPATSGLDSLSGKVLGQAVTLKSASTRILSPAATSFNSASSQLCLECHSPIAQSVSRTPHAHVGVGCENCHGPSANHAANEYDPAARPRLDNINSQCGTCHSGPQHPIYGEWQSSEHAKVGVGCSTCHEPHNLTSFPDQLRATLFSTNDYYTTAGQVFPNNNNPRINLCAQCHNDHGATWTTTSAPPLPTVQYNMLLGTVGELNSGLPHYDPSYHALFITNQCVGCHMQTSPYVSPAQPAVTGHKFTMDSYGVCADCHGTAANASNLVVFVSRVITNQIQTVQASLNLWALTQAPLALTAKYGIRAWEYTKPGSLYPGGPGPTAGEQTQIPDNIKKARFNLYLVLYDGSLGTHNGLYSFSLLEAAQNWVNQELSQ